jgi:hypothetical protein
MPGMMNVFQAFAQKRIDLPFLAEHLTPILHDLLTFFWLKHQFPYIRFSVACFGLLPKAEYPL